MRAQQSPVAFYKALAEELRLKSLLLIEIKGELCVCELMEALQQPQPKISRHLALLRKAGLLLDRRQGQWVYYRLSPELEGWKRQILSETAKNSTAFINEALQRLASCEPVKGQAACC